MLGCAMAMISSKKYALIICLNSPTPPVHKHLTYDVLGSMVLMLPVADTRDVLQLLRTHLQQLPPCIVL